MKIKTLISMIAICFAMAVTSCGGSESNSSYSRSENQRDVINSNTDNQSNTDDRSFTFKPASEMSVRSVLANQTFRDNDGNSLSFRGTKPMNVEFNGAFMANDIEVMDYGYTQDGGPFAIVSVTGPYGHTSLFITELDTDYGNLNSRVVLFDVNDKENLFYRN